MYVLRLEELFAFISSPSTLSRMAFDKTEIFNIAGTRKKFDVLEIEESSTDVQVVRCRLISRGKVSSNLVKSTDETTTDLMTFNGYDEVKLDRLDLAEIDTRIK